MTTTTPSLRPIAETAPFLVWPVGRREFYAAIAIALVPTLTWGSLVFGFRVVGLILASLIGAAATHFLLKRFTTRGRHLVLAHTLLSAAVLTAQASPLWPAWVLLVAASLMVLITWAMGGPGAERVHASVLCAVVITAFASPYIAPSNSLQPAFLTRDRLFMGDIRSQSSAPLYDWPVTVNTSGFDAVASTPPATVAHQVLDRLTSIALDTADEDPIAGHVAEAITREIDMPLTTELPPMHLMVLGVAPGQVGVVSALGIVLGGLYLAYRNILRPRSVLLFLAAFLLGSMAMIFNTTFTAQGGVPLILRLWQNIPGELGTLLAYSVLNSDVIFAAIVILALPGTEPLTSRGRRVFLVVAGLAAAYVHRQTWSIPAATTVLLVMMPIANLFDLAFRKPSWLAR